MDSLLGEAVTNVAVHQRLQLLGGKLGEVGEAVIVVHHRPFTYRVNFPSTAENGIGISRNDT